MKLFSWVGIRPWTLGLIFAVGVAQAYGAPTWRRLETEDFVIVSDATPQDIADFAAGYSAYRYAFRTLFVPSGRMSPAQVILFRRASDFEKRVPKPKDDNTRMLVYSGEVDTTALLALAVDGDREEALRIAYESETIWGLRRVGYAVPLWASQGAGEVLSTLRLRKGKCVVGLDSTQIGSFPASFNLIPWEHFFEINTGSREYSGEHATGKFHPQAWGLMHWILLDDDQGRDRFRRIATGLSESKATEVVPMVMGRPLKELASAISHHFDHERGIHELPFDEAAVRSHFKIEPASEAEVKVQLSTLFTLCGKLAEADRELQRAEQLAPDAACVKEALARRELRENRVDTAAEFYRAAIAAGSQNPTAYMVSARARLDQSSTGGNDYEGAGGRNIAVAIADIRHVLELDPTNAAAYQQLGRAYYLAPQVEEENLNDLNRAVSLYPHSVQLRQYRAMLCHRLGKTDEYLDELQRIVNDPETPAPMKRQLEERLSVENFNRVVRKANALTRDAHYDEALAWIESGRAADSSKALEKKYDSLRTSVLEQKSYSHLRTLAEAKQWADLGNEAQAFLTTYPKSKALPAVENLLKVAQRHAKKNPGAASESGVAGAAEPSPDVAPSSEPSP